MNETIMAETETISVGLRDLIYEVHAAWTKNGMRNDALHAYHLNLLKIEAALASAVVQTGIVFGAGQGMTIREIKDYGQYKKIQAIKAVREITKMGLKEAKEVIDNTANGAPAMLPPVDVDGNQIDPTARQQFVMDMNNAGYVVT